LDSHEAIVIAVEEGWIVRLFHYVHDPAAFTTFWSAEPRADACDAARAWVEGWSRAWPLRDADLVAALYTEDALFSTHPFRPPQGPRAYAAWAFADQRDVEFRFGEPIVAGDRAAVDWWAVITTDDTVETIAGRRSFASRPTGVSPSSATCGPARRVATRSPPGRRSVGRDRPADRTPPSSAASCSQAAAKTQSASGVAFVQPPASQARSRRRSCAAPRGDADSERGPGYTARP
jgi:hypothetical protein